MSLLHSKGDIRDCPPLVSFSIFELILEGSFAIYAGFRMALADCFPAYFFMKALACNGGLNR